MAGIDYNRARELALQVKRGDPSARNVPLDTIIKTIMQAPPEAVQTEQGMATPGTTNLGMLFQPPIRTVTPASPAPMQPGIKLQAPKPTTQIVPGGIGGPSEPVPAPSLPDKVRQSAAQAPAPAPARTEAPLSDEPVAAPKAQFKSRFRPLLESTEYELQQLDLLQQAAAKEEKEVPPEVAEKVAVLSNRVTQLKSMVAAEEGAVVNADRAAILERQTKRLGREEELIQQARKRAPGEALMKFGAALAGAEKGESFASALARGLQAGSESYSGARESREDARRRIEERRDALALQNIDALQKARDEAISLQDAGYTLDKRQREDSKLTDEAILRKGTRDAAIEMAVAQSSKAKTEALYAPQKEEAGIKELLGKAKYWESGGGGGGGNGAPKPMTENQRQTKIGQLNRELRAAQVELSTPGLFPAQKKAIQDSIIAIRAELEALKGTSPFLQPTRNPLPANPSGPAPFRWDPKAGVVVNK